ncbi:SDR family oxidoreductase [Lichenicoccus sp.]|uniref:SDR family oxidoreductase n=1 Tax=Lichenicoccus sp. TaxID=2781899 RepID=UPI003D1104B2
MNQELAGKVVLVTGASSGIGRAMARSIASLGAHVALSARSLTRLEALQAEIGAAAGLVVQADLAVPADVEHMVAATLAHYGRIDVLLANAGLFYPGLAVEADPDRWDQMLSVNVNSVFRAVRAVLPGMIERRRGDIVVTSSISGHQALHTEPVYSASKHAVQAFVHGVRRQVADSGVRVGSIAPGIVLNELWGYHDADAIDAKVAAREGLRSEDVADAVIFMLTRPRHVTIRDLVLLPQNQDI